MVIFLCYLIIGTLYVTYGEKQLEKKPDSKYWKAAEWMRIITLGVCISIWPLGLCYDLMGILRNRKGGEK